tara:strand:+ start:2120 stop:2842 length:723 start_codon:yes stop_codon:yes gene_type:complete
MKKELEFTIDRINQSKLYTHPYCYLEINEIFSKDFYHDLILHKPRCTKYFRPLSKMYSDRYILELGYGENTNRILANVDLGDNKKNRFWKEFQKTFIENKELSYCFIDKYKGFLNTERAKMGKINCRLSKDLKGYSIGVHRDKRDKVLSALFYIPDESKEDRNINWGTQILVPKQSMKHTDKHHPYNDDGTHNLFDLYKTITYEPNKMFSWCITENSYHGVPPIIYEGVRDSIAFFVKSK